MKNKLEERNELSLKKEGESKKEKLLSKEEEKTTDDLAQESDTLIKETNGLLLKLNLLLKEENSQKSEKDFEDVLKDYKHSAQEGVVESFQRIADEAQKKLLELRFKTAPIKINDIQEMNVLLGEITKALTHAGEIIGTTTKVQELSQIYKKNLLSESGFNSADEVRNSIEVLIKNKVSFLWDNIRSKEMKYFGLGRLIYKKEIEKKISEYTEMEKSVNQLGDLLHEIKSCDVYTSSRLYAREESKRVIRESNIMSMHTMLHYYADCLKEINFSLLNPKAFEEIFKGDKPILDEEVSASEDTKDISEEIPNDERLLWAIENWSAVKRETTLKSYYNETASKLINAGSYADLTIYEVMRKTEIPDFFGLRYADNSDLIQNIDIDVWKVYRRNKQIEEKFGKERIESMDHFLENEIISQLLQKEEHTAQSVDLGYKLLAFPTAKTAPLAILNAYRESGHSGERPLLSIHDSSDSSLLFKFISSLDEEQLEKIEQKNIQGCSEIIDLIKNNPKTFNSKEIDNPVYAQIQQELISMSEYYLKNGDKDMQFYLMDLLKKLPGDLGEIYDELKNLIVKSQSEEFELDKQQKVVQCLLERANKGDAKSLEILFGNYSNLSYDLKITLQKSSHELVNAMVRNEFGDSFSFEMSGILECSEEDFLRTLSSLKSLRKTDQLFANLDNRVDLYFYIELFRNPDILSFVETLKSEGFYISKYEKFNLPQIYENRAILLPAVKALKDCGAHFDLFSEFTKIKEIAENDLLDLYTENKNKDTLHHFLYRNIQELAAIPKEKRKEYIEIFFKIDESPSQEIQRLRSQILEGLLETDDPIKSYEKIESIFIKNNLPMVGKIFKIFEVLHSPEEIKKILNDGLFDKSPVLTQTKSKRRVNDIFYRDLLKIHIASVNRSLRQYCEILSEGEEVLNEAESKGIDSLTYKQHKKLGYFFDKIDTLFVNSALGKNIETEIVNEKQALNERYQSLRQSLGCKEDQKITERIGEMFLRPVGLDSLGDVLAGMRKIKESANERGLKYANQAKEGLLELQEGDLLKGVKVQYIENILQNGSVAKEFLGAGASSDSTPFDTDVSMVMAEDLSEGFSGTVSKSLAAGYGEILFVVKNRGQFDITNKREPAKYNSEKLELFATGGGKHYGIRTGFPTTEIDFMILKDSLLQNKRKFNKICYEISQNSWYIPITDTNGKIMFTHEMYQKYRKIFDGLSRFDGDKFEFIPAQEARRKREDYYSEQLKKIVEEKRKDQKNINYLSETINETVKEILQNSKIIFKDEFSTSIVGAELLNIGSTGRGTNLSEDYDFDFTLRLDAKDFQRAEEVAKKIKAQFVLDDKKGKDESHSESDGYYQLKISGITEIAGKKFESPLSIDIGFAKKSDLIMFGSHDAVSEKLNWIEKYLGEEIKNQVVANIVLCKKILGENNIYAKTSGGIGGIGVENWILANNGNIKKAFESFYKTAYKTGKPPSFSQFKESYALLDAGINTKKFSHDNFIENITSDKVFEKMFEVIKHQLILWNLAE